jgi:hypothetical protein
MAQAVFDNVVLLAQCTIGSVVGAACTSRASARGGCFTVADNGTNDGAKDGTRYCAASGAPSDVHLVCVGIALD